MQTFKIEDKMKEIGRIFLIVVFLGSIMFTSCVTKKKEKVQPLDTAAMMQHHYVKVGEVIQTTQYTYLFVTENENEYWMAVRKMDAKTGDSFYYDDALEMTNFESKELNRIFDRVLFVQNINEASAGQASMPQNLSAHSGRKTAEQASDINVEPANGSLTIAEVYKNRNNYAGKKVLVRGKVVKINKGIMGRNWVHLQDGTNDSGNFDLTFTTQADANLGDVIALDGTVTLNKDFGAGYLYDVIVEDAVLK